MPTRKLPNPDDFEDQILGRDLRPLEVMGSHCSLNYELAHVTEPQSPAALLSQLQRKSPDVDYYSN